MRVLAFPESTVPEPAISVETDPRAHRANNPYEYGEQRGRRPLQRRRFGLGNRPCTLEDARYLRQPLKRTGWFPKRFAAAVLACVPDLTGFTPTPVISWDPVPDADLAGYVVYYTPDLTQTFQPIADLPCFYGEEGDYHCPTSYPTQRASDAELVETHFCVRAYDTAGNLSAACSNVVSLCAPDIWRQGEQYSEQVQPVRNGVRKT